MNSLLVIAGPTASGKSALALSLSGAIAGEIINCDSLQLYRGFDVGTAKTPPGQRHGIPHHLFDVLDANSVYTAGDYARLARHTAAGIAARGHLPVVVGGTGFYLRAFLEGLPPLPGRDELLRESLAAREERRAGSLWRLLRRLDPESAGRIHGNDTQKLIRALEIRLVTREQRPDPATAEPLAGFRVFQIGLAPDREQLATVIAERTRRMFDAGLLEEVRGLLDTGCTGREKPFEALGYKQALQHLRGELSLDAAIESTTIETRQYAKRQRTWFRRDPRVHWLNGFGTDPEVQAEAATLLREFLTGTAG